MMRDERELVGEQGGGLPIFWVTLAGSRGIARLRYGALLFFLPLLASFSLFFGPGHDPGAPFNGVFYAALLVIGVRGWMLLLDLLYRLASRERRFLLSYLISSGLTAALALLVCFLALLLDALFSPSGHFFAVQGFFAVLLTFWAAPIAFSFLAYEPPGFYWQVWQAREGRWSEMEEPLRGIVDSYPRTLRPALLLLDALLVQGKRDAAMQMVKHLVSRHPQAWGGWAALGTLALEDEQWEKAVAALCKAYRLAPRAAQGGIQLNLGLARLGAGELDAGCWELEQAGRHLLPAHLRQFCRFMLMRLGQIQQDPGRMLSATQATQQRPKESLAFLDWYETLDRSRTPTLGEDLYEAADWTRHLLGIRLTA